MAVHFRTIEKKWQKRWDQKKAFQPSRSRQKKIFLTVPYPYTSGPLHIGHARTYTLADIWARYKRMQGFNVLFPMAFHISGTPILSVADRIREGKEETLALYKSYVSIYEKDKKKIKKILDSFKKPEAVADFFASVISRDFKALGFSVDWSRTFTTGDSQYNKFIEWQFLSLKKKGLITRGQHPVLFCPKDQNAVGEDDIRDGDILDTRIESFTLVKFPFLDGFLPAATLRPETIFGVTNIWINPEGEYCKARVDGEIWYVSSSALEKLRSQNHVVEKLGGFPGKMLLNQSARSPVDKRELPVLPGNFVDPVFATGVVYSVPAHSPDDFTALRDLGSKIEPRQVIAIPGYGEVPAQEIVEQMKISGQQDREKLKDATKKLYRDEFYKGILKNSGKFSSIPVRDIKNSVKDWLKKERKAMDFFLVQSELFCRCGEKIIISVIRDQWFIDYGNSEWKSLARQCLDQMKIVPDMYRSSFESTIDWLHERACARKRGLGTKLPFDKSWVIESLSDSTIYPAFYVIAPALRKIPAEKLTPEVFDFVFLGKGSSPSIEKKTKIKSSLLQELRKDFDYWYPVDDRHTAIPHLTNHLTFYIFNHALLFPQKYWPKMISLNELLVREGSKMSKSKGNVIPLADIEKKYSADFYRLFIAYGADMNAVIDWTEKGIEMVRKRVAAFAEVFKESKKGKEKNIDLWLVSRFHAVLKEIESDIEQFNFRGYVQRAFFDLMNDLSYYVHRGGANPGIVKDWIKVLSPVIPHLCEELWERSGGKGFVSLQPWPSADGKKINPRLERQEELIQQTVEDVRQILRLIQKKPQKIHIYTAPGWKHTVLSHIRSLAGKDFSIKELMQIPEVRKEGKSAIQFAEKLRKEMGSGIILSEDEEFSALEQAKGFFEKQFLCSVEMIKSAGNRSPKSLKAEPGRPGIEVF